MRLYPSLRNLAIGLLALLLAPTLRAAPVEVVATFSILGDLVHQVGGEHVRVVTLVGPDADTHNYQARPSDARLIGNARLVVANGMGFDAWIDRLVKSAGYSGQLLMASEGATAIGGKDHHGHKHGAADPHMWQSIAHVERYVQNIAEALSRVDPANAAAYRERAGRYAAELKALDAEIRQTLATVPSDARKVVSSHESFTYFDKTYGVRFLAAKGISNESEPSAADVARLIRQLRKEKVVAVFIENISDPRLAELIRKESGARLGGTLYSDALSAADGPAPTYVALMRHNLATLMASLRP